MEFFMYKIVCNDLDVNYAYVGSTNNFAKRMSNHKNNFNDKTKAHLKIYQIIKEHGGWNNWTMVQIEKCYCDSTLDARKRERYFYEELNANMNMIRPMCTLEEAKEKSIECRKQYRLENQDTIKQYRLENQDTMKQYQSKYRFKNKDKIKQHYQQNKERIAAHASERIHCEVCNCEIRKSNISTHNKSKKHMNNTSSLEHT